MQCVFVYLCVCVCEETNQTFTVKLLRAIDMSRKNI